MTRAAVLGAGFAGLAAAIELAERGVQVTLYERRPYAGGRVYSFTDKETGQEVDNGQHVFLACCPVFRDFIRKIGVEDRFIVQPRTEILFIDARTGKRSTLKETSPALSLLGLKHLGLREKWRIAMTIRKIGKIDPWAAELEQQTFGDWLRARGATERAIAEFWDIFILAAINDRCDRVAAAPCIFTFQEAFAKGLDASRVGYPKCGQSVIANGAVEHLKKAGGQVEFNRTVKRIAADGFEFGDGTRGSADLVIAAMPHGAFRQVLAEELQGDPFFSPLEKLGTSPIVNVNLWYDQPAGDFEFAAVVGSPIPWLFNRARILGLPGSVLNVTLSGERDQMTHPKEAVVRTFDEACRKVLPELREAKLTHSVVIREANATFEWAPGADVLRRPYKTPVPGLFLAGDWTANGWPSTMEGALRSGQAAARAALESGVKV